MLEGLYSMRTARKLIATATACLAITTMGLTIAPTAHADAVTDLTDNPSLWSYSDNADIYQWINTSTSSTHPRYSIHRVGYLYDSAANEAVPAGSPTYLRLVTSFTEISGGADKDTFTSAVRLPAGVRISNSSKAPMFCRYAPGGMLQPQGVEPTWQTVTDGNCRQSPTEVGQGITAVNSVTLQRGDMWEVYLPIVVDKQLAGEASGDVAKVEFLATHERKDMATLNDVATATVYLKSGPPSASTPGASAIGSSTATAKAGQRCGKAGAHSGSLTCVKKKGKLTWRRA